MRNPSYSKPKQKESAMDHTKDTTNQMPMEENENLKPEEIIEPAGDTAEPQDDIAKGIFEEEIQNRDRRIAELESSLRDAEDRLTRKVAEFENFRRRTALEKEKLMKYGSESFILDLLPVVDDLERAIAHLSPEDTGDFSKGVVMIYDNMMKTLQRSGITKIEAVGQPFNFEFHSAVSKQPNSEVPPETVLQELVAGYMYNDKVLRHSQVIVSDEAE